ncbi:hypothetical protein HI914_00386 [Erysiphe necator]|nr:hypothetical protein HI914_00386 [Erysiphe necator]
MVSLWPWRSEDNSPASFEKILAALATKISKSEIHLENLRSSSRKYKALWTLYTTFLYLFGLVVLVLVVGWKNWTILEGTALAGWPTLIYVGRLTLKTYYNYRIDSVKQLLEEQQTERFKTIEKLKAATKYNTTHELLEKYGQVSSHTISSSPTGKRQEPQKLPRTSIIPPPTANILKLETLSNQEVKSQPRAPTRILNNHASESRKSVDLTRPGSPEFAPNAFSFSSEYVSTNENIVEGHWYDRILDILLGEDETLPKNRLVLICQHCRLINGQAPPGTKSLENLGKWRCYSCNSMNGEEVKGDEEVKRLIDYAEISHVGPAEVIKEERTGHEPEEVPTAAFQRKSAENLKIKEPENSHPLT